MNHRIAIVGAGCTRFAELFDKSYSQLLGEAVGEALGEAKLGFQDLEAAWLGTAFPDMGVYKGRSGLDLAENLGPLAIPITRVSNYCATGAEALRGAAYALLAGQCKIALAVGVEKLRDRSPQESIVKMMVETGHPIFLKGFTAAGTFAVHAVRHFHEFGLTRQTLAEVSVKNHRHALWNPRAHYRKEVTREQVLQSPMVAYPLTVLDSCPTTDGAAAVVLCREEDARAINPNYVVIKGLSVIVTQGWELPFYDPASRFLGFAAVQKAAATAYTQAGVKNPLTEIDLAEVHDCFSITELMTYEDLGLCASGQAARFLQDGIPYHGGKLPVNVSGGLLSCGHPIGATGLRMIYELTRQLQGKAGQGQVPNAKLGLAQTIGGPGTIAAVTLVGLP